jgi:hypothetical protein
MPLDSTIKQEKRKVALTDVLQQLAQFNGPPDQFLAALLHAECKIAPAQGGAILRISQPPSPTQDQSPNQVPSVDLLAVHPPIEPGSTAPTWLARAVELAPKLVQAETTTTIPIQTGAEMYTQEAAEQLIALPIRSGPLTGLAIFHTQAPREAVLGRAKERLELMSSLLSLYEFRKALENRNVDLDRLSESMQVLSALNEQSRMRAASFALCNEVASRWNADRVSIGFLKGRYIKMLAMSHTEKFTRKMKLVQDIESAMEECLDQDVEVVHPADEKSAYVARATKSLSNTHGPTTVLSLPLRREGNALAVLTIERAIDKPFNISDIETLRLTCDLITARLSELYESDRWIGAKLAASTKRAAGFIIGAEHTLAKLIVAALLAFFCFAIFVKGPDRVETTFEIQPTSKQVITAPFVGYIETVNVEQGDWVLTQGTANQIDVILSANPYSQPIREMIQQRTILATLNTAELQDKLSVAAAELATHQQEARKARDEKKQGEVELALKKAEGSKAQISLLRNQISQATIKSSINGVVVLGDLKKQIGVRVDTSTQLFEIAPLDALRAELAIPEDRIADVVLGHAGELSSTAAPGTYLPFEIERINPVAEMVDQQNVFKARAKFIFKLNATTNDAPANAANDQNTQVVSSQDLQRWLKPGIKGVAKIEVGQAPYGYIWTRDLVNWIRMKLWF